MTKLLLGSGGIRTEERVRLFVDAMRRHLGAIDRILFVPYALADHDGYVAKMTDAGLAAGYELDGIHRHDDPVAAIREAQAIFVGGGNTFRLVDTLHRLALIESIRERVGEGTPYIGVSAGTNVACPTLQTTNDMPIVAPPSFRTLGLVPFQINPHYFPGRLHYDDGEGLTEHFGETRDDRIREYHEINDKVVVGLREGSHLTVKDRHVELHGSSARIFRSGQEPEDLEPGSNFDFLLDR